MPSDSRKTNHWAGMGRDHLPKNWRSNHQWIIQNHQPPTVINRLKDSKENLSSVNHQRILPTWRTICSLFQSDARKSDRESNRQKAVCCGPTSERKLRPFYYKRDSGNDGRSDKKDFGKRQRNGVCSNDWHSGTLVYGKALIIDSFIYFFPLFWILVQRVIVLDLFIWKFSVL